ncbi:hypothetical protein Agabi119p4_8384 [Agaricus bisporus var. burnettii]|uniref:Ricin B lectin domain-containing protein n=1 Tax=Agaricus bisporus var. burnettii TaxID=192524 RepID=A0A8H7C6M9_AGABI|nr:hypothetical protein Agabi119p4_8384 [Agaricus bisporus var. burnettii]
MAPEAHITEGPLAFKMLGIFGREIQHIYRDSAQRMIVFVNMLSSKFFSLLTFAAAAVAQGFPKDPFFIVNTESELVFEAEYRSSDSEVLIALSERDANNGAQIWTYTEGRGFLKNQASGLVLEVPRTDGRVDYGTRLQVTAPRNETNDDLTQLWDYDAGAQHLFTLASESACVAWNNSFVYAVVDYCDPHDNDVQRWTFIDISV